jgi:hypothetical protein
LWWWPFAQIEHVREVSSSFLDRLIDRHGQLVGFPATGGTIFSEQP